MKLVFFETGDYLDIDRTNTKVVNAWFDYIFDNEYNHWEIKDSSFDHIEKHLTLLNRCIIQGNEYLSDKIKDYELIREINGLDQNLLNDAHKKWAVQTGDNLNVLHPQPRFWHEINDHVHALERHYYVSFRNTKCFDPISADWLKDLDADGCDYGVHDLVISYRNLGRHQYNQWLTGSAIDRETNNYDTISMDFEYHFDIEFNPNVFQSPEPPGYREWCIKNNLKVLPPWIRLGKFMKYDRFEIRKLIHNNLKKNTQIGFVDE